MKHHLKNLLQILAGLVIGVAGIALTASAVLPMWLAAIAGAVLLVAFASAVFGLLVAALLYAGMLLQVREHNARMATLLKRAGVK